MLSIAGRNRAASAILDLTQREFHGHSSYSKYGQEFSCYWAYYPTGARGEIIAELGYGYETKIWNRMTDEDRRFVLIGYLDRAGFTREEFGRLVDNVVMDRSGNPATWFEGIAMEPSIFPEEWGDPMPDSSHRAQFQNR